MNPDATREANAASQSMSSNGMISAFSFRGRSLTRPSRSLTVHNPMNMRRVNGLKSAKSSLVKKPGLIARMRGTFMPVRFPKRKPLHSDRVRYRRAPGRAGAYARTRTDSAAAAGYRRRRSRRTPRGCSPSPHHQRHRRGRAVSQPTLNLFYAPLIEALKPSGAAIPMQPKQ